MTTPTTTIATIREKQEDVIIGLTPDSRSDAEFVVERAEFDFREWCEDNPVESFRKFSLRQVDGIELSETTDGQIEQRRSVIELVVSYPKTFGAYGGQGSQSMLDVIREDQHKIETALGPRGAANYVAGQHYCADDDGGRVEEGEAVDFLVFDWSVDYNLTVGG